MRPGVRLKLAAVAACVLGLACSAAHAQSARKYGALAIDRTNGFYFGFAVDHDSAAAAEKRAVEEGNKRGGKTSVVLLWSGAGCGAYRSMNLDGGQGDAYGWGLAAARSQAEAIALREAQRRSNGAPTPNQAWACNSRDSGPLETIKDEGAEPGGEDIVLKNARLVSEVAFSPDSTLVATLSYGDAKVMLWDTRTGALVRSLEGLKPTPNSIAFSPDGRLAGTDNEKLIIWNPRTGEKLGQTANDRLLHDIAFTADGAILRAKAAQEDYGPRGGWMIYSFDGANAAFVSKLTLVGPETHGYYDAAFSPSGSPIVTGGDKDGEELKLWSASTGELLRKFSPFHPVRSVAFSRDGQLLAVTGDSGVEIRNGRTGDRIRQFGAGTIYDAAFSPDGAYLATAHRDRTVGVWEVSSGRRIHTMTGHGALVQAVAFSPDGQVIVSGSEDGTARLWNASTGAPLKAPKAPASRPAASRPAAPVRPAASGPARDAVREAERKQAEAAEQAAADKLNQEILARDNEIKAANEKAAAEAAARQEAFRKAMSDYEAAKARNDAEVAAAAAALRKFEVDKAAADAARAKYEADKAAADAAQAKYEADMRAYQQGRGGRPQG